MPPTQRRSRPAVSKNSSRTPTIVAIGVVVLLAVVVIGGVVLFSGQSSTPALTASPVPATYPTTVQNGVITAGRGPTAIDVYEDAQCPACKSFEDAYRDKINTALQNNKITVHYHLVNLLEKSSNPPGYSSLAGGALMCAAENNAFAGLHAALYEQQPPEGGRGFTADQLVDAGNQAGAGPGYAGCVRNGTHTAEVGRNFQQAVSDPALQQESGGQRGFGTPTVVVGGKLVQPGAPELTSALS